MTGLFSCTNDKIYVQHISLDKAVPCGASLTTSTSHQDLWEDSLTLNTEYTFFTRGRVEYKEGVFYIYLDLCLDYLPAIEAILAAFKIDGEPWVIHYDEHCQCAACVARVNGEVVFDSATREVFDTDGALDVLRPAQYPAFEVAMQQAFIRIYKRPETQIQLNPNGHIELICQGELLDNGLSKAEQQATELAYKAALAKVLGKKLVLFRPTECMDEPTAFRARRFIDALPREQVIISAPFGGY